MKFRCVLIGVLSSLVLLLSSCSSNTLYGKNKLIDPSRNDYLLQDQIATPAQGMLGVDRTQLTHQYPIPAKLQPKAISKNLTIVPNDIHLKPHESLWQGFKKVVTPLGIDYGDEGVQTLKKQAVLVLHEAQYQAYGQIWQALRKTPYHIIADNIQAGTYTITVGGLPKQYQVLVMGNGLLLTHVTVKADDQQARQILNMIVKYFPRKLHKRGSKQ